MSDNQQDGFYSEVAKAIRDERNSQGLSQKQLADKANDWADKTILTRNMIANIETGRQQIPLFIYIGIVNALNVGFEYLLPTKKNYKDIVKKEIGKSKEAQTFFKDFFDDSKSKKV